jgi:hypothetical protein
MKRFLTFTVLYPALEADKFPGKGETAEMKKQERAA